MRAGRTAIVLALAFVITGMWGVWSYGHDYYRYRGFGAPRYPPGVTAGQLRKVSFTSPALGARRSYDILLPAGFDRARREGRRFGVLYLLHGSPGWPRTFVDAGALGVAFETLVARGAIRPFLIVMPDGRDGTYRSQTEWSDTAAKGRYESFVLDVVRAVDRRWPTRADRRFRAIAGNSEGAYGAINIALRHLDVFAIAQSWSGYFTQTASGPFHGAPAATLRAASPASYVGSLRGQLSRRPLHAFLYGGSKDPGSRQLSGFATALRGAGADVVARTYRGRHDWGLWRRETPTALRDVAAHLGRP